MDLWLANFLGFVTECAHISSLVVQMYVWILIITYFRYLRLLDFPALLFQIIKQTLFSVAAAVAAVIHKHRKDGVHYIQMISPLKSSIV